MMIFVYFNVVLTLAACQAVNTKLKKTSNPPHCTQLTKDTDYASHFKYDYPIAYIQPGQREAYQKLYCIHPPAVNKAVTVVCDWGAPPQVEFTLGDEYVHVARQDPTGRFLGNAIITTFQLCSHNMGPQNMTSGDVYIQQLQKETHEN